MNRYLIYNGFSGTVMFGIGDIIETDDTLRLHFEADNKTLSCKRIALTGFAHFLDKNNGYHYYKIKQGKGEVTFIPDRKRGSADDKTTISELTVFLDENNNNPAIMEFEDDHSALLWAGVKGEDDYSEKGENDDQ